MAHCLRRRASHSAWMLPVCMAFAAPAYAHSFLVSRGEVVVHADHVDVTLELTVEDLLHWYDLRPDAGGKLSMEAVMETADEHAHVLERTLVVRDQAGKCLRGECQLSQFQWLNDVGEQATYTWTFPMPDTTQFLMFGLRADALPIDIPWQVALNARGASQRAGKAIRLTTRGNVEVLELYGVKNEPIVQVGWALTPATKCDQRGEARFKEICADVEIDDDIMDVSVSIPLALLATWMNVPVDGEAYVGPQEQASVIASARDLLAGAIEVQSGGKILAAQVVDIHLVPIVPHAADRLDAVEHLNLLSGRVLARLRFQNPNRLDSAKLQWKLFNSGVLNAHAFIRAEGKPIEHDFSTYQPILRWKRNSQPDGG